MATRIPAAEARKHLADVVQQAQNGERIKLTRYDKTVAVIIPKNDLTSLEECEETEQSVRTTEQTSRPAKPRRAPPARRGPGGK
jgi:prevent-host-death family protein